MLTERLATFVAEHSAGDIPDDAYDAARDAIIDTLGVALAGSREPVANIAASWISENSTNSTATVWGRSFKANSADAAFANGISAHALDFDDSLPSGRGHISACLVPTVLTLGETLASSGEDVLAAYVVGLEVAGVIGRILGPGHQKRGWHPTATVGTLAAAAAAARLSNLDVKDVTRALGMAASQVGGLARNFGTMTKSFHVGRAAQTAVVFTNLIKKGFTADEAIFDGAGNILEIYAGGDGESIEDVISSLCDPWTILSPGNYVKRWPCCYSGHRTAAALIELIEQHDITADNVTDVSISFLPGGDASLISTNPQTALEGKFSIEYIVAALLLDGTLKMSTFTDEMVQRSAARRLMQRVHRVYIPDESFFSGIAGYNDITVTTKDEQFEVREDRVPGSHAWPLSKKDHDAKFSDCASPVLGENRTAELLKQTKIVREIRDIHALVEATVP